MSENRRRRRNVRSDQSERADRMGTNVYSSKDNKSMHKSLNSEFILYQILLERILNGKDSLDDPSLFNYFQPDNKPDQDTMKEFDTTYKPIKAIHWYTRESCIYRILNKALRTQNTDDILPFGPFIRDLNTQLSEEHKSFVKQQNTSNIQVYRGQLISKDEVNRLKSGQGEFISMNSFLSTSTNRKKALEFATSRPPPNDELTSILLEITVDLNALTRPYADIKHLSAFAAEEEILFMFGCVFRLDQIEYDEKIKLWTAKLTVCSENDPDMKDFSSSLQEELKGQNSLISLGNYFIQMLKFDDAQQYFEKVLENNLVNDPIELAYCHHGLGKVNEKKGNLNLSIENLNKSLNYLSKSSSPNDHPLISQCYNDLGSIYFNQNDSKTAFDFYEKALNTINNSSSRTFFGLSQIHFKMKHYNISLEYLQKTLENQTETTSAFIADTYIHMGKVYTAMNQKDKASQMFDKATQLQLKDLPPTHPDMGSTYSALALMHSEQGDQQKAFEFVEKAHQLQSQVLPNNHPDFGESYQNFADLYMKKGDFDNALINYKKLLENQLKTLSWSHPSVAQTYSTIGHVNWKQRDYDQASFHFRKVIDSELERKTFGQPSLSFAYKTLGDLYLDKYNNYSHKQSLDDAFIYYQKYLENELFTKLSEDISLIPIYEILADISYKKHDLRHALLYYNRLFDCYLRKVPFNQSAIDHIYTFIGKIYLEKHHVNKTLLYYHKIEINQSENELSINNFRNIDSIHFEKRHLDQAFNYFQKILNKQLKNYSRNDPLLNNTYIILANISLEQQNFDQALNYFQALLKNNFGNALSARIYLTIANIYAKQGQSAKALENYRQSLHIYQLTDPQNHSVIRKIQRKINHISH